MKIYLIIFVCFVLVIKTSAQQWIKANPTFDPPGNYNTYRGVFVDENHGWWLAGFPGIIWKTTDRGSNWIKQIHLENVWFWSISFVDSLHGWVSGSTLPEPDYKYFFRITKDGGKTWHTYSSPRITSIFFFDSLNGFAGGEDNIYSTTDGGITWIPQEIEPSYGFGITDIFFINRKIGWAVGLSAIFDAGVILNTVDSGKTWQFNDSTTIVGNAVYFTDYFHGWIVGSNPPFFEGVIKITSNGGETWSTHYLPGSWLNDVVFIDDSTGWAVGDYGFIWHTTDRGINWIRVESGTTSDLHNIFFFNDEKVGYILGEDSTFLKYENTVDIEEKQPFSKLSFKLFQNYPNPFNPSTSIKFDITHLGLISLSIYDLLGKEVITLVNQEKKPGSYTVVWNGRDKYGKEVSSGIYIYQLISGSLRESRKLIFIK